MYGHRCTSDSGPRCTPVRTHRPRPPKSAVYLRTDLPYTSVQSASRTSIRTKLHPPSVHQKNDIGTAQLGTPLVTGRRWTTDGVQPSVHCPNPYPQTASP